LGKVKREIVIDGDGISFRREVELLGQTIRIAYVAKLVDGELQGTGTTSGLADDLNGTTPFTATREEEE
jgi:hypothetical protein